MNKLDYAIVSPGLLGPCVESNKGSLALVFRSLQLFVIQFTQFEVLFLDSSPLFTQMIRVQLFEMFLLEAHTLRVSNQKI